MREAETSTIEELVESNMRLVKYVIHQRFRYGDIYDDLVGEGMLGLVVAARTYDENKGRFAHYAYQVIYRAVLRERIRLHFPVRKSYKEKHVNDNPTTVSLDVENDDEEIWADAIPIATDCSDPVWREALIAKAEKALDELPPRRREALKLYWSGKSKSDIAERMGVSRVRSGQLVQDALEGVRKKLGVLA